MFELTYPTDVGSFAITRCLSERECYELRITVALQTQTLQTVEDPFTAMQMVLNQTTGYGPWDKLEIGKIPLKIYDLGSWVVKTLDPEPPRKNIIFWSRKQMAY